MKVYTNEENIPKPGPGSFYRTNTDRWADYDALFLREGGGTAANQGEDARYIYCPDLNAPKYTKMVILKGTWQYGTKNTLDIWESKNKAVRFRIIAYTLENAEPQGIYYSLEYPDREDSELWYPIMTFQQDGRVAIPSDQVQVLNNKIAYVFMGSLYAATTDGGKTWSVWDAENEVQTSQYHEKSLIQNVRMNSDGSGEMELKLVFRDREEILRLRTNDYGKYWGVG